MSSRSSQHTRARILDAADDLVLKEGVGRLTLSAVAELAEVSKGGVLYHFSGKEELIRGMIARFASRYARAVDDAHRTTSGPGAFTRAYVRGSSRTAEHHSDRIGAALLAAAATDPELIEPLHRHYDTWQERLQSDGIDPTLATLVRLAMDGLWLAELFELAPPDEALKRDLLELAEALTEEEPDEVT